MNERAYHDAPFSESGAHRETGSIGTEIVDDFTDSVAIASNVTGSPCWTNLRPRDVAIEVGTECVMAANRGEFGATIGVRGVEEPRARVVVESSLDNVVALARLGDGTILVVSSYKGLNGRLFKLARRGTDWSWTVLAPLPGDVLRIGKDEHAAELVLVAQDLQRRNPSLPQPQLRFRCDRWGRLKGDQESTDATEINWIWPAR
jgi:hypothetical protein